MNEATIQCEIVKYLQSLGIFCHSVPNEAGGRSAMMQMQLISMGLRPGVGDLIVWWRLPTGGTRLGYLEIKTATGKQSEYQVKFEKRCHNAGVGYAVCRSVADVKEYMRLLGIDGGAYR